MARAFSFAVRSKVDAPSDAIRTCTPPKPLMGRTSVREQLTEYAPGVGLAYRLDGTAGPFSSTSSRWSTAAFADGVTIVTVKGCQG